MPRWFAQQSASGRLQEDTNTKGTVVSFVLDWIPSIIKKKIG